VDLDVEPVGVADEAGPSRAAAAGAEQQALAVRDFLAPGWAAT
jgi:hypothetical protein